MPLSKGQRESRKQENDLALATGGRVTPASGAFWNNKGDIRSRLDLIEAKWTGKKQYTIKSAELKKIHREAILDGRVPVLAFRLEEEDYVILSLHDFLAMRDG